MTQDEVRRLFDYDANTGDLTWRVSPAKSVVAEAKAGSTNSKGYLQVQINRRLYKAHRLIWLWVHGYFPEHQVDHINRDKTDNRLANLREVTPACNRRNSKRPSTNTSGVTGVCWEEGLEKWRANITVDNRKYHLGRYTDFTEAVKARHQAEVKYGWPGCNSSTPAYQYLKEMSHGQ